MTDEDLIAVLKDWPYMGETYAKIAANRIEELVKELQDTQDRANAFATREYYTEMRAERAEAKLAKAVEALKELATCVDDGSYCSEIKIASAMDAAFATLAELEGETK